MYGFNAYGNYGYGNANPPPPPPPAGTGFAQQVAGAVPTTNYNSTQFAYPTGVSAYAQFGATATQQQTVSSIAGYGQQAPAADSYSADYSMFKAPVAQPATVNNFTAAGRGGGAAGNVTGVNSTPLGYEQAVFNAAASYLQAKNVGKTNNWMGGKRGGGAGVGNFRGASGPGATKKRYGLGHQNREPQQQFFCEVCKITCAGNQTYKEHLEGKAHKKKEAMSKGTAVQSLPRNKVSFKCDVCNVTCTGRDTYDAHVKGVKHQKTIALMKKMGQPVPAIEPTLIPPKDLPAGVPIPTVGGATKKVVGVTGTKFVGGVGLGANLNIAGVEAMDGMEQALLAESKIKPVGQEFIEEHKEANGKIGYSCKLCDCKFTDPNAKDIHLKGRRHRLQYKTKINPSLEVEFKMPNNAYKKGRGQREDYFNAPQMYRPHPMGHGPAQMRSMFQMPPMGQSVESSDDRHVVAKNDAIHPTKAEMDAVEKLVAMVERTLKNISDKFAEDDKAALTDKIAEPERLLKGVMRVGLLAKNLLLSSDKEVDLVVLCSKIPTETLIKKISELFPGNTEKEDTESLQLIQNIPQACLVVKFADIPVSCRITFTSVLVREISAVSVAPADGTTPGSAIEKPVDALPVKPCLNALAELRHAKYYQVKCAPLHSMNIALRIVRDISRRVKTWAPLSEWAMELLTEKTLSSIQVSLGPGDAIRRVFEVIAGGIILNKGSGLVDPCEKETKDVLANLSEQEREDISSSAQHALRLISFNQIYKILAIDRLPDKKPLGFNGADRKRARESNGFNSSDGTTEVKKEKKEVPTVSL